MQYPLIHTSAFTPFSYSHSFFFTDTATTEIYTLSLHDALPICLNAHSHLPGGVVVVRPRQAWAKSRAAATRRNLVVRRPIRLARCCMTDRKSTRLNSSHSQISYAVFCLKKKNK